MTIGNDNSSPKMCGKRIRYIRDELLGLSRREFAERHKTKKITKDALQNWEEARFKGLKLHHIEILLRAFEEEGVLCDRNWLLDGAGDPPRFKNSLKQFTEKNIYFKNIIKEQSEEEMIAEELRIFREHYKEAVDAIIGDAALVPCYMPGDYVAGIRYTGSDIQKAIGFVCIVQTQAGQVLTRKLERGTVDGYFNLVGSTPSENALFNLTNVKLFSAAPVIWIRKPLFSLNFN